MPMKMVKVKADEVDLIDFGDLDPRLRAKFERDGFIYWPHHPNNTETKVPYFGQPEAGTLDTRYTASRSLLSVEPDTPAFTIKAGTDYPHKAEYQGAKAFTKDDVDGALLRQPFINAMNRILPEDDTLVTLPEALVLRHKETGEGVLVRDLSKLDRPDRIYVTGLSIPYAGRDIAAKNGQDFAQFWTNVYSENLGRAKARFLIKYGLEMETPNSQNILIEFTKDFKPTGKVVLRDTVDSYPYAPWLKATGMKNTEAENVRLGYDPRNKLDPFASNSHWRFDEAGKEGFSNAQVGAMNAAHDKAWMDEIKRMLNVNQNFKEVGDVHKFLESEAGQQAIRDYHQRLGTLPLLEKIDGNLYPKQGAVWSPEEVFASLFSLPELRYAWA